MSRNRWTPRKVSLWMYTVEAVGCIIAKQIVVNLYNQVITVI